MKPWCGRSFQHVACGERIKRDWPSDIPLPEVRFGIPVEPINWAATFHGDRYARAKAALAIVRQGINIDAEERPPGG
jgi:hypothetical protein